MSEMSELPVWDGDLHSARALADPYPLYTKLRRLGPVVRLARHGVIAVTRYAEAHRVLHRGMCVPQPQATENARAVPPALPAGLLAGADGGELLIRMRARAEEATARHIARAHCVDMVELARELMADLLVDVLGLPPGQRTRALEGAAAPADGTPGTDGGSAAGAMLRALAPLLADMPPRSGSLRHTLHQAAVRGRLEPGGVLPAVAGHLVPALDVAAHAAVHTLALLAEHPPWFSRVRSARDTAEGLLHETLRWQPPVHTGVHRLTQAAPLAGPSAAAGTTLWLLYACAGRDPRHFGPTAHLYRPERPQARDHLLLGTRHDAPGHRLATTYGRTLISALARHCTALDLHGPPARRTTASLRGYTRLLLRVTPDGRVMRAHRPAPTTAG